jgi:hypothetical protein
VIETIVDGFPLRPTAQGIESLSGLPKICSPAQNSEDTAVEEDRRSVAEDQSLYSFDDLLMPFLQNSIHNLKSWSKRIFRAVT